jgi:hypothetical protein
MELIYHNVTKGIRAAPCTHEDKGTAAYTYVRSASAGDIFYIPTNGRVTSERGIPQNEWFQYSFHEETTVLVMDWNRGFCGVTDEFPASATEGQLYTLNVPFVELNQTQVPEEEDRPQSAAASDQPALADGDAEEAGPGTKEAAGASKGEQMAQQDKGGLQR